MHSTRNSGPTMVLPSHNPDHYVSKPRGGGGGLWEFSYKNQAHKWAPTGPQLHHNALWCTAKTPYFCQGKILPPS